jgi:hypothetical protein
MWSGWRFGNKWIALWNQLWRETIGPLQQFHDDMPGSMKHLISRAIATSNRYNSAQYREDERERNHTPPRQAGLFGGERPVLHFYEWSQ